MSDTNLEEANAENVKLTENLGKAIVQLIQDSAQEHDNLNPAHVLVTLAMVSSFFLNKLKISTEGIHAWADTVVEAAQENN